MKLNNMLDCKTLEIFDIFKEDESSKDLNSVLEKWVKLLDVKL